MKQFFALCITLLTLCTSVFALYNGNPAEPELIDEGLFIPDDFCLAVKLGYQGDIVFDRKLKARNGSSGRMDESCLYIQQGVLTLNLIQKLELYGSLGAMNAYLTNRPHFDEKRREYQTDNRIAWGAGGRMVLFNWDSATVGLNGSYFQGYPHLKWDALNGVSFPSEATVNYHEWQVGLGVSYQVDLFCPYVAVTYSDVRARISRIGSNMQLPKGHFTMKSRDKFGLALGCSLTNAKIVDLNLEVRLIDEEAVILAGNIAW